MAEKSESVMEQLQVIFYYLINWFYFQGCENRFITLDGLSETKNNGSLSMELDLLYSLLFIKTFREHITN